MSKNIRPLPLVELPAHLADFPINGAPVFEYGSYMGIDWVVTKNKFAGLNGYIRVPEGHPWAGLPWLMVELMDNSNPIFEEHPWGELTFSSGRWFGFDAVHAWDWWPVEFRWSPGFGNACQLDSDTHLWSVEAMREATLELARRAWAYSRGTDMGAWFEREKLARGRGL